MGTTFVYDRLVDYQYRLFKIDIDRPSSELSGQLVTLHHPRHHEPSIRAIARNYLNWNDMRYLERSNSGYDALSYVWGTTDNQQTLLLRMSEKIWQGKKLSAADSGRNHGTVSITWNLYEFLVELRNQRYDDFIWIDAICINQCDAAEKSMQIPLMRNIYEQAKRVLIWLGKGDDVTQGALRILPNLTKIFERIDHKTYVFDRQDLETFATKGLPPPDSDVWQAIGNIMAHPWFTRLWTLQEIVLPETAVVLCGSTTVDWESFASFARATRFHHNRGWSLRAHCAPGKNNTGWDSCAMIDVCRELREKNTWGVPLTYLLGIICRRRATVPTDMVFGMMGLMAGNAVKQMGPVDVTWPLPRVYVQFAQYYMHEEVGECILNHIASRSRHPGLPSWCPDFSQPEETAALGSIWYYDMWLGPAVDDQRFRAGWRSLPVRKHYMLHIMANTLHRRTMAQGIYDTSDPRLMSVIPGSDRLLVRGMLLDTVVETIGCNPGANDGTPFSLNALKQTLPWEKQCLELAQRTLNTNDDAPEVYYRTMVANQIPGFGHAGVVWDVHDTYPFADAFRDWRNYMAAVVAADRYISPMDNMGPQAYHVGVMMIRWTRQRCFFVTRSGRIGLGPADTRVGDELCVLWYCPTPYLLRSSPEHTEKLLVGESYVHGLMYAQALDMLDRGEVCEQAWTIK